MTLPARQPEGALCPEAEKALALWRQLGLTERALDALLALPPPPEVERRAEPRAEGGAPGPHAGTAELRPAATPQEVALRRRLLLEARDGLLRLAAACDREAAVLGGAFARTLLLSPAPPSLPPGSTPSPPTASAPSAAALSRERPVLRAARDRRIGRSTGVLGG